MYQDVMRSIRDSTKREDSVTISLAATEVDEHTAKRQATDSNVEQRPSTQEPLERAIPLPSSHSSGLVTLRLLIAARIADSLAGMGTFAKIQKGAGVCVTLSGSLPGAHDRIFTAIGGASQLADAIGRLARVLVDIKGSAD